MSRGLKVLFVVLLGLIAILAAGNGLFYAKIRSLEKKSNSTAVTPSTTAETTKNVNDTTSTTTDTSAVTTPAPLNNRPSSPSDTVTVAAGQTLFQIGQQVNVTWTILADVNGINADNIKAGQIIIVPQGNEVDYKVNQDKAQSLQTSVNNGQYPFRLSPADTAKSDSPTVYGLTTSDTFTQTKVDETAGNATVTATHGGKTYLISLVQPVTKGAKGIWAIESIKPQS